jgi:hypothetical protein
MKMQGIQMDLISEEKLAEMAPVEKVRFIIDEVRSGKILVLEKGLTPEEEASLIEMTMTLIEPEGFSGIEMESYPSKTDTSIFGKLLKKAYRSRPCRSTKNSQKGQKYDKCTPIIPQMRYDSRY